MVRRSARIRAKQLMLEGDEDTGKVMEDVLPQLVAAANDANSGTQEDNEASSSSSIIPSAREKALQNPVILHHLFQLCPASTLISCRLVSKLWYEESLVTWRTGVPLTVGMKNTDICLVHQDPHFHFGKHVPPNTLTPLKKFLKFCNKPKNQCSSKPYRNIAIRGCQFSLNSAGFEVFWKEIGRNMTILNLSGCRFASVEEFRQVIYKRCPVLQQLEIFLGGLLTQNDSRREEYNELQYKEPVYGEHKHLKTLSITYTGLGGFPVSWMEILSHFTLLSTFTLTQISPHPEPDLETFVKIIREIRKTDTNKLPFKRFQLYASPTISRDPASHRKFALAKELCLPLTHFDIEVHPKLDQRLVRNTLKYLATSVNNIRIFPGQMDNEAYQAPVPTWFREFPFGIQMNNLTRLILDGDLCGSFTFLKYAPNLSALNLSGNQPQQGVWVLASATESVSNTCKEELANFKMVRLTVLTLEFVVTSEDMRYLFNWMPNITHLEMILNDEQFALVCQNWKILRRVRARGTLLTTDGVTGIRGENGGNEVGIRPNIANLELLEYLFLEIHLIPESVYHLFLHLPSLQELKYDSDRVRNAPVKRKDLDISAYQRAIQDNVVEQWILNNAAILGE